jgi:exonuclease SbcC
LVSKELAHFAHNLHDGENCPLWIAEHPNVMQTGCFGTIGVEAKILKLESEMKLLQPKSFQKSKMILHMQSNNCD